MIEGLTNLAWFKLDIYFVNSTQLTHIVHKSLYKINNKVHYSFMKLSILKMKELK